VVNPFFLVDKLDLSFRFILNLSSLNLFIEAPHFKLEDGRTAARLLSRGDRLAKVDLQNAYYSVPVRPESSRFLRFSFEGTLFEFTCLPFGLNLAPFLSTKLMRAPLLFLREQGLRSVNYLDDFLPLGSSASECLSNIHQTTSSLTQLGFTVNPQKKKTQWAPTTSAIFLGLRFNSLSLSIELPEDKQATLLVRLRRFLSLESCTIRDFASFIGQLNFCCQAVPYGASI